MITTVSDGSMTSKTGVKIKKIIVFFNVIDDGFQSNRLYFLEVEFFNVSHMIKTVIVSLACDTSW